MYIKNIYNIRNFKGIPNGFKINFRDITYVVGDNAKNKTTIGSIPLWILTGYSLNGGNSENVASEQMRDTPNTIASMTFIDNDGTEHTITRCKGKDNFVLLDDMRTTKDILSKFYKDVHSFICAYNPIYFRSLDLNKQRELLERTLPSITSKEAFEFLNEEEKNIIEDPIEDIKEFNKNKRSKNKELSSELDVLKGMKATYVDLAIKKEEPLKEFNKESELRELQAEYEKLISNSDKMLSIDEIETKIRKIDEKINNNIKVELVKLQEKQKTELKKLEDVSSITSTCPTCRQQIKNEKMIETLQIGYKRNINNLADDIENLKNQTQALIDEKNTQINNYNLMRTPEMQELSTKRDKLKEQIDILLKEKSEIDLYNRELTVKHNQIVDARNKLDKISKDIKAITEEIEDNNKKIVVAKKLEYLVIHNQMEKVKQYLKNVTIELYKYDEIKQQYVESYEIRYKGKLYEQLSKSYKLRADIEIAGLINKIMDLQAPMFIDDVESITNIELDRELQVILALVVKYNELEIYYSYSDVLLRERESINRKIAESSSLLQVAA